jgi:hypothetical protein
MRRLAPPGRPVVRAPLLGHGRRTPLPPCDPGGSPARHSTGIDILAWSRGSGSSGCRDHQRAYRQARRQSLSASRRRTPSSTGSSPGSRNSASRAARRTPAGAASSPSPPATSIARDAACATSNSSPAIAPSRRPNATLMATLAVNGGSSASCDMARLSAPLSSFANPFCGLALQHWDGLTLPTPLRRA